MARQKAKDNGKFWYELFGWFKSISSILTGLSATFFKAYFTPKPSKCLQIFFIKRNIFAFGSNNTVLVRNLYYHEIDRVV